MRKSNGHRHFRNSDHAAPAGRFGKILGIFFPMTANLELLKLRLQKQILEAVIIVYCCIMTFALMQMRMNNPLQPSDLLNKDLFQLSEINIQPTYEGTLP